MRIRLSVILTILFLVPSLAMSCSLTRVKGANTAINPNKINDGVLAASILAYTNQARCKAGRSALKSDKALIKMAQVHSKWMAGAQKMSHKSTVRGWKTLGDRLKKARAKFRVTAAENIGTTSYLAFPRGVQFKIVNAAKCQYKYNNGKPIPAHTYDSLAKEIVGLWMASPKHKANIMIKQVDRHGATVRYDPKAQQCGKFYATQVFAG